MLNPVLTQEQLTAFFADKFEAEYNVFCISAIENDARYDFKHDNCNALTISDEPFDLASEIEPSVFDRFMCNDGTPAIEHRLRKQGLRKFEDQKREEVQECFVEVFTPDRKSGRVHILRQTSGDRMVDPVRLCPIPEAGVRYDLLVANAPYKD